MSLSEPGVMSSPSWRAAQVKSRPMSPAAKQAFDSELRKLTGPVTYTQPSGADVFPFGRWLRALRSSLRRH